MKLRITKGNGRTIIIDQVLSVEAFDVLDRNGFRFESGNLAVELTGNVTLTDVPEGYAHSEAPVG
jgi:hypothetical protein